jgi:hypothetical protein
MLDGIISERSLKTLAYMPGYENFTAPLYRTLVADRGPNRTRVPAYYQRACQYCLRYSTANGHINTKELLKSDDFKDQQSILQGYLERVRAVTWNRVILEGGPRANSANSDQMVGLGPPKTQAGDVIAIFYGCSVPVILHPIGDTASPQSYEFVGEAYIYGKMDGEAMFQGYPEQSFVLY